MKKTETIKSVQFEDSFYPVIDGVVKVVDNYAALMNKNAYSCVVCPKAGKPFDDSNLPYDVFRMPSFNSKHWQYSVAVPGAMKGLYAMAKEVHPDILHVHSPFTQRTAALKLARKLHIPIVATFHTKYYDDFYQSTKSRFLAKLIVRNIISFYEKCDSVWACSEGTAHTLREYGYKGKITVMPNGTKFELPENPDELKADTAERFCMSGDKKNLLFIGTQVWQKNMKLVLDTMQQVVRQRADVQLFVVGGGRNQEEIRQYAGTLGLGREQVCFLGKIEEERTIKGLLLNTDLFFFPSVYDNAPIVLREASAMEVPSLLVKGSNAADVIRPDENGFIAEEDADAMAQKILSVIADADLLEKVGLEASRTIPIPWEEIISRVSHEYAEIIRQYHEKR